MHRIGRMVILNRKGREDGLKILNNVIRYNLFSRYCGGKFTVAYCII